MVSQRELRERQRLLAAAQRQAAVPRSSRPPFIARESPEEVAARMAAVKRQEALASVPQKLFSARELTVADRALVAARLRAQSDAAEKVIAEARERAVAENRRLDKRFRPGGELDDIRARSDAVAASIEGGSGSLTRQERVAIGRARFPDKKLSEVKRKFLPFGSAERSQVVAGQRRQEELRREAESVGFRGTPAEFAQRKAREAAVVQREAAILDREVFVAGGKERKSVLATPEQVVAAQKSLLRKRQATLVTEAGAPVGVVGTTVFAVAPEPPVAESVMTPVSAGVPSTVTGVGVESIVGGKDEVSGPFRSGVGPSADISVPQVAVQEPSRLEEFEKAVGLFSEEEARLEESPFVTRVSSFAEKGATLLPGGQQPFFLEDVPAEARGFGRFVSEVSDRSSTVPSDARVSAGRVTEEIGFGLLSAPLLFTEFGKAVRKVGLTGQALTIPETRPQVGPELLRAAKEVEKQEFSFLPFGTPVTESGGATAIMIFGGGLFGRRGPGVGEVVADVRSGVGTLLETKAGKRGGQFKGDVGLRSIKSSKADTSRSLPPPRKRGTAGRKPQSLVFRSKVSRGLVPRDTFSGAAKARKAALRQVTGRTFIDISPRGGGVITRAGTPPKKAKIARDVPFFEQFGKPRPEPRGQPRKPRQIKVVDVVASKTLRVPGGGKVQVFFKDSAPFSQNVIAQRGQVLSKRAARRLRGKQKAERQRRSNEPVSSQVLVPPQSKVVGKKVKGVVGVDKRVPNLPAQLGFTKGPGSDLGRGAFDTLGSTLSGKKRKGFFVQPPELVEVVRDSKTGLLVERPVRGGFRPGQREKLFGRLEERRAARDKKPVVAPKPARTKLSGEVKLVSKVDTRLGIGLRAGPRLGIGLASAQTPRVAQAQRQDVVQDEVFAQDVVQDVVQREAVDDVFDFDRPPPPGVRRVPGDFVPKDLIPRKPPRVPPPRKPPRDPPPRKPPKIKVPKVPGNFVGGSPSPSFNKKDFVDAFLVELKRKGKFVPVGRGLSRGEALRLGSKSALESLAATFRVRREGRRVRAPRRLAGFGFVPRRDLFREFKIRSGKKIATPGTFIQRRGKRLVTRREVSLLQRARKKRSSVRRRKKGSQRVVLL